MSLETYWRVCLASGCPKCPKIHSPPRLPQEELWAVYSFCLVLRVFLFQDLFMYFILMLAVLGLRCCGHGFSSCSRQGLPSIAVCGLPLLQSTGSRCTGFSRCHSWALQHRLCSCGSRTLLFQGTWGSSQTRGQTGVPCVTRLTLNYWTLREALRVIFKVNRTT